MNWVRSFYRWIDPDRLIPGRVWVTIGVIALLSGLLFFATLLLALLRERSISRAIEARETFQWTIAIGEQIDSLQNQAGLYDRYLHSYVADGDSNRIPVIQDCQDKVIQLRTKLDSFLFIPENRVNVRKLYQLTDTAFAVGAWVINRRKQGDLQTARSGLSKLDGLDFTRNIQSISEHIYRIRGEKMHNHIISDSSSALATFKALVVPLTILSGVLFSMLIMGLVFAVHQVKKDRRENKYLFEEQKKSAELARSIMNLALVGYHSIDSNGVVVEINQTELDWLGYARGDIVGKKHFSEFVLENPARPLKAMREQFVREGYLENVEMNLMTKSGEVIPCLFNAKAVYHADGSFSHSISTIYNFSERKKLENQLVAAREEAEHANHMKQLFMANMSHEIRTPLNAIIGFSNLLARAELPSHQHEYVEHIQTSGKSLLGIVNDILDFERIRSGELRIDAIEFDLNGLLHSVVTMVRPTATDKQLTLYLGTEVELPDVLIGDPMRLTQILVNLLGNAVKFTEKGHVTLRVSGLPQPKSADMIRVRFEVEDSGIGIPESNQARIFDRFVQESAETTRKYGGSGLGLTLVKMLTELQQGSVEVVSTPGKGSVFSVEIPFRLAQPEPVSDPDKHTANENLADLGGYSILLVEDNPINSRIAELYLLELGLSVTFATNGFEAVKQLRDHPDNYHLVLMDIQMPEMDGYTATRIIRSELGLTTLPIIAMTAHVLAGERENILANGMNDYLTKPINHNELITLLKRYLHVANDKHVK